MQSARSRRDVDVVWLDGDAGPGGSGSGPVGSGPVGSGRAGLGPAAPRPRRGTTRGGSGPRRPSAGVLAALLGLAGVVGAVVVGSSPRVEDAVRDVVAPLPDAALVLPEEAERGRGDVTAARDAARREQSLALAGSAQRTWAGVLADLAVPPTPQLPGSGRVAAVVDAGNGRWLGVQWQASTALGPRAQWMLTAQVARRASSPAVDACPAAAWGLPGGRVLRCDVVASRPGAREVRGEALPGPGRPHPVESAGASSAAGRGDREPSATVGYQRVVEIRDGARWVQLRLARRLPGDAPAPLGTAELAALAADDGWHER